MKRIGIRELRQQASKHLRDVENGETIEVTDRGRPVARLVPVPQLDAFERLVAEGRIAPPKGSGDLRDLPLPLPRTPGMPSLSEELARIREDER